MITVQTACGTVDPSASVTRSDRSDGAFGTVLGNLAPDPGEMIRATTRADRPDSMLLHELHQDATRRRNRRELRRGQDMLSLLGRMQRGLLEGDGTAAIGRMSEELLGSLPTSRDDAADADLAPIVQAIALRLKVELARRETGTP